MYEETICTKYKALLGKFLDNELSSDESGLVKQHVGSCIGCAIELEKLREIDGIGKAEVFPEPGKNFWTNQRRKIAEAIGAENTAADSADTSHFAVRWTKKFSGSFAWRTAVSLSAAAVLIFVFVSEVNEIDYSPMQDETLLSNLMNRRSEQQPGSIKERETMAARETGGNVEESRKSIISEQERALTSSSRAEHSQQQIAQSISDLSREEGAEETNPLAFSISPDSVAAQRDDISIAASIESTEAAVKLQNQSQMKTIPQTSMARTGIPGNVSRELQNFRSQALKSGNQSNLADDTFDRYIERQKEIKMLEKLLEQKEQWFLFLTTVKNNVIRDLVVYDLYELYTKIVVAQSPKELKKEALDFMIKYERSLVSFLGRSQYNEKRDYFKKLM